jgi:hypothetical protein
MASKTKKRIKTIHTNENQLNGAVASVVDTILPKTNAVLLDLGCGMNKRKDKPFKGVDAIDFPGVDQIVDLRNPWPWADNSVDEVHSSHFLEHLEAAERIHFVNELYRVLKPGRYVDGKPVEGFATIIAPNWSSQRAYGDMTHKWPPVCGFWPQYLSREWRLGSSEKNLGANAPHDDKLWNPKGYSCNFDWALYNCLHPDLVVMNSERSLYFQKWNIEAIQDLQIILVKKV